MSEVTYIPRHNDVHERQLGQPEPPALVGAILGRNTLIHAVTSTTVAIALRCLGGGALLEGVVTRAQLLLAPEATARGVATHAGDGVEESARSLLLLLLLLRGLLAPRHAAGRGRKADFEIGVVEESSID